MSDLILKKLRPRYHFSIPGIGIGYPGDSNGAFWHNGHYHLMYLFRRLGSQIDAPGQKHDENGEGFFWGHISSTNLVDWTMHGDAIGPSVAEPNGCLSGGGFINDDGVIDSA